MPPKESLDTRLMEKAIHQRKVRRRIIPDFLTTSASTVSKSLRGFGFPQRHTEAFQDLGAARGTERLLPASLCRNSGTSPELR